MFCESNKLYGSSSHWLEIDNDDIVNATAVMVGIKIRVGGPQGSTLGSLVLFVDLFVRARARCALTLLF